MPRRRKRKKVKHVGEPELDPDVWHVTWDFRKGVFSGNRIVIVEVHHLPSNRKLRDSVVTRTKNDARAERAALIRALVSRLEPT